MFSITTEAINSDDLRKKLENSQAGAFVCFEGWVRNHNEGKGVLRLEYESYENLANSEGKKIIEEAKAKFDIHDALAVHRTGKLEISEMAVWVGVISSHRKESFQACEFIIDEIKARVPIWKKEFYNDGNDEWIAQHNE